MKTVKEFYQEFSSSKALREELKNASDEMLKAFLTKHGCEADAEKFLQFAREHSEGEIPDDNAAQIAGGAGPYHVPGLKPEGKPIL